MIDNIGMSNRLALDVQGLGELRGQIAANPDQVLQEAARQFESLLFDMMMKSMRQSVGEGGLLDSEHSRTFTALLDQQFAQNLAASNHGLADLMLQQIRQAQESNNTNHGGFNNGANLPLINK
ncbi:MAG: rod-binding protein [Pseudomonadota bacterium]